MATSINRLVSLRRLADKFAQTSATSTVAGPFFNLSAEPVGVVGVVAPVDRLLLAGGAEFPALVPGDALVVLACEPRPLPCITFTRCWQHRDIPGRH